jgi:hypothetical protein
VHRFNNLQLQYNEHNHCTFILLRFGNFPTSPKSKSKLYYERQSVDQSVLVSGTHLRAAIIFSPSSFKYFWAVTSYWCGAPSLMRGRVYSVQLLLGLANAVFLGSESHRTDDHILRSQFLRPLPQPGGQGSCIYFPQGQGNSVITPGIGFRIGVVVVLAAGSQSTSSSGYRASLWDPWPDFILLFFLRLTITLFFFLRSPLWRENGSVVYSAITHWSGY